MEFMPENARIRLMIAEEMKAKGLKLASLNKWQKARINSFLAAMLEEGRQLRTPLADVKYNWAKTMQVKAQYNIFTLQELKEVLSRMRERKIFLRSLHPGKIAKLRRSIAAKLKKLKRKNHG